MDANRNNNKKLSKVLSTKISIEDYNAFLTLTKLEYQAGLIKEQSTSELLRFTIRQILNQLHNNLIYPILEEQEQEQQKKAQNNKQQLVNPVILPSTTVAVSHQHQPSNNLSRRNNLVGRKMTPWKLLSSSLSTQANHHNTFWW
jgi:hypothetical protein